MYILNLGVDWIVGMQVVGLEEDEDDSPVPPNGRVATFEQPQQHYAPPMRRGPQFDSPEFNAVRMAGLRNGAYSARDAQLNTAEEMELEMETGFGS